MIRAESKPWRNGIAIAIIEKKGDKKWSAAPITMNLINDGEYISEALSISFKEAQILMDDLWQCGLRPSEGTGSAGQLAATQKHLSDMRLIAFKKLLIEEK